jgi:glycine/D-amino acid oxidase-like deaminating enzyme
MEVYPRNTGELYICGLGGSDMVDEARLLPGGDCDRPEKIKEDPKRVAAGSKSFRGLSESVGAAGPQRAQACMRPCPPDALPIMVGWCRLTPG